MPGAAYTIDGRGRVFQAKEGAEGAQRQRVSFKCIGPDLLAHEPTRVRRRMQSGLLRVRRRDGRAYILFEMLR